MIAFLSVPLSLELPPFLQETLGLLTNVAKFDIGIEFKKALLSYKFRGNWWLFRRHQTSYGILKISASGEEKAAASFQCYRFSSACWVDAVSLRLVNMWHWDQPKHILPHGPSVAGVHARYSRGAWAQVRECGGGMEAFWRSERSKRTWQRVLEVTAVKKYGHKVLIYKNKDYASSAALRATCFVFWVTWPTEKCSLHRVVGLFPNTYTTLDTKGTFVRAP